MINQCKDARWQGWQLASQCCSVLYVLTGLLCATRSGSVKTGETERSCFPQQQDVPEVGSTQGSCSFSSGNLAGKFLRCFSQKHQNGETSVCLSIGLVINHSWCVLAYAYLILALVDPNEREWYTPILSSWSLSPPVGLLWVTSLGCVTSNCYTRRCVDKGRNATLSLNLSSPLALGPPCLGALS